MHHIISHILAGLTAAAAAITLLPALSGAAVSEQVLAGYLGDVTGDKAVTGADAWLFSGYLRNAEQMPETAIRFSDVNEDGLVNGFDLAALKAIVLYSRNPTALYDWVELPEASLIPAPAKVLEPTMPSLGKTQFLVFSVEFPDCTFDARKSNEQLKEILFGPENTASPFYPEESITAFYERASYGNLHISGEVFSYTAKEPLSAYVTDDNKQTLVREVLEACAGMVDYGRFDANQDGVIDCSAFFVPPQTSNDDWWPCSVKYSDPWYQVNGFGVGNFLIGNTNPEADFAGTMIHELGHAMGLPDYYKYNQTYDFEGFHGATGYERMDEGYGDLCCFSKLMLGWLREDQVQIYDGSDSQTFSLSSAQKAGGCVLIPKEPWDGSFYTEYFLVEYITPEKNFGMPWYNSSGVRIFHVNAAVTDSWWGPMLAYENFGPWYNAENGDTGIRVLRLVNDGSDYFFETGNVVNGSTPGFAWYDYSTEQETVSAGLSLTVGELTDGQYTITVSKN